MSTLIARQMHGTIRTSHGRGLASHPARIVIPTDPQQALLVASHLDRRADHLLFQGRPDEADRLAHLAHEARCRAAGGRA